MTVNQVSNDAERGKTYSDHSQQNAGRSKEGFGGVMIETSFARFRPSMATPREERIRSRPFESLDSMAIVETGGCRRKKKWRTGFEEKAES